MAKLFYSSDPKQPFYVVNQVDLTSMQEQVLTKLYQPLIGAGALSLYLTLIREYSSLPLASDYRTLLQLQTEMDCGLRPLFSNLHKLEAVGLVRTFLDKNVVLGQVIKLQLRSVPSAKAFFDEFLLRSLLLEKVGPVAYRRLKKDFSDHLLATDQGKELTASFFDVFSLSQSQLAAAPLEKKRAQGRPALVNANTDKQIDWTYLQERLQAYHISTGEINRHRQQIAVIMNFYGYSVDDFVKLILPTLIPGKDELNMKLIEQAANEAGQGNQSPVNLRRKLLKAKQKPASAIIKQLSPDDDRLLKAVNQQPPAAFLEQLKQAKGGYVTAQERRVVFNLQNRTGLTPALTNLVVKTCLDYDAILTQNRADRIANDWLQHGATTTAAALAYSQKFKQGHWRRYGHRGKRVEQGTDWQQKPASHQSRISPAQLQQLLQRPKKEQDHGTH